MLTITLLVLLGCTGTQDTDSTVAGDADTDSDTDADSDADTDGDISASFDVLLPAGVTGTVSAYLGDEDGYEDDGSPADATCDATSGSCTATVTEEGIYWIRVASPTAIFQAPSVTATKEGAEPETVEWVTGGCQDADWAFESGTCENWLHGEWILAPNGTYGDDGGTCVVTSDYSPDITGDGIADLTIDIDCGPVYGYMGAGSYAIDVDEGHGSSTLSIAYDLSSITMVFDGISEPFTLQVQ